MKPFVVATAIVILLLSCTVATAQQTGVYVLGWRPVYQPANIVLVPRRCGLFGCRIRYRAIVTPAPVGPVNQGQGAVQAGRPAALRPISHVQSCPTCNLR